MTGKGEWAGVEVGGKGGCLQSVVSPLFYWSVQGEGGQAGGRRGEAGGGGGGGGGRGGRC